MGRPETDVKTNNALVCLLHHANNCRSDNYAKCEACRVVQNRSTSFTAAANLMLFDCNDW